MENISTTVKSKTSDNAYLNHYQTQKLQNAGKTPALATAIKTQDSSSKPKYFSNYYVRRPSTSTASKKSSSPTNNLNSASSVSTTTKSRSPGSSVVQASSSTKSPIMKSTIKKTSAIFMLPNREAVTDRCSPLTRKDQNLKHEKAVSTHSRLKKTSTSVMARSADKKTTEIKSAVRLGISSTAGKSNQVPSTVLQVKHQTINKHSDSSKENNPIASKTLNNRSHIRTVLSRKDTPKRTITRPLTEKLQNLQLSDTDINGSKIVAPTLPSNSTRKVMTPTEKPVAVSRKLGVTSRSLISSSPVIRNKASGNLLSLVKAKEINKHNVAVDNASVQAEIPEKNISEPAVVIPSNLSSAVAKKESEELSVPVQGSEDQSAIANNISVNHEASSNKKVPEVSKIELTNPGTIKLGVPAKSRSPPDAAITNQPEMPQSLAQASAIDNKEAKKPGNIESKDVCKPEVKKESKSWTLNDFQLGKSLGSGKFGQVYLVREKSTKVVLAMKTLYKATIEKDNILHQVRREIEIQASLRHRNILKLFGYFHSEKCVFIVLEYAKGGELYKYLHAQPNRRFSEPKSADYTSQLTSALIYCHSKDVIHRDLKPENILISASGQLKIADFGWSVQTPNKRRMTLCGTLDYLAPEIVDNLPYDEKVDNWSLGVLIFEFLSGKPSFETETQSETLRRIKRIDINFPRHFSSDSKDLISSMLKRRPADRMPLEHIPKHPWMVRHLGVSSESS